MSERPLQNDAVFEEIQRITTMCLEGSAPSATFDLLEQLVSDNPEAADLYVEYLRDSICLRYVTSPVQENSIATIASAEGIDISADSATDFPQKSPPLPPVILPSTLQGSVGYFSSGWPVAYLIATAILGVGFVIGAFVHVSQPAQVARRSVPSSLAPRPSVAMEFVGRITGMVDCQWADPHTAVPGLVAVPLGRKYAIASGLLEISYDTGARVILQGPCTYEVESAVGGYLSLGKLTARVEKRGEGEEIDREGSQNTPYSVLRTSYSALFAVRTPTAIVTDLGTEFGVEVDEHGGTASQVFRGAVELRTIPPTGQSTVETRILHANESARVEGGDKDRRLVLAPTALSSSFVREIPQQTIRVLDLVDVVAGGDGFSGKRGRGIDPPTGGISDIFSSSAQHQGDYRYHRVEGMPFVDGVFIPDGSKGPVKIDSAGHVFPDCPKTDNRTWLSVWAGGRLPQDIAARMSPTLAGIDYFAPEHAALFMHANKGLTFDLDAIRQANPECEVLRFRATAGNMEPDSEEGANVSADVWVLVDGQVRFKRREINHLMGAMPINIRIGDKDRFLTLSATDGGNSYTCDQVIFGDPRLELATAEVPAPEVPANDAK